MTVKSSISFTDRHHQFVREKVDQGASTSVSSLVALGIEKLMQDEAEQQAMLNGLTKTIRQRMETPQSEWVTVDDTDPLFDQARARLQSLK